MKFRDTFLRILIVIITLIRNFCLVSPDKKYTTPFFTSTSLLEDAYGKFVEKPLRLKASFVEITVTSYSTASIPREPPLRNIVISAGKNLSVSDGSSTFSTCVETSFFF